jgi:DNA-binding XRE family transcriptional regulator
MSSPYPTVGYLVLSWRRQRRNGARGPHPRTFIKRTRQAARRLARDLEWRGHDVLIIVLSQDDTDRLCGAVLLHWPPRLRQIRIDLDLTQAGLARELNVSKQRIKKWEQGRAVPRRSVWRRLLILEDEAADQAGRAPEALDRACVAGPVRIVTGRRVGRGGAGR